MTRAWANQARHRETGHIHECYELASLHYADDGGWECPGCAVPLIPCAWNPNNQPKKAPYFRTEKGRPHKPDCFVHRFEDLAAKGRSRRISADGGFPVPYPNRIILAPRRVTTENLGSVGNDLEVTAGIGGNLVVKSDICSPHNRTSRSIREACWFFTNFPYDRDLPLRVDGCSGTRYDEIFVRIGRESEADIGPRRILYGEMRFRSEPVLSGEQLTITLLDQIIADGRKRERKVMVQMAAWPQHLRDHLWQHVQDALGKASEAHGRNDRRLRPWLFFVGAQESAKQELFQVRCYAAISVLACQMPKVSPENRRSKAVSVQKRAATFPYSAAKDPVGFSEQAFPVGAAYIPRRSTETVPDQIRGQHWAHLTMRRAAPQATVRASWVTEPPAKPTRWLPQVRGTILSWFRSLLNRDG
jgi:hypothetical protein